MEVFTPLLSPRRIHPTPVKERTSGFPFSRNLPPPLSILTGTMSGALRQSYGQGLIPINSMEKAVDVKEYCRMSYLLLLTLW